jgi:hypothetical protein
MITQIADFTAVYFYVPIIIMSLSSTIKYYWIFALFKFCYVECSIRVDVLGPGSMVDPLPTFNFVEASQPGWWIKY